MTAEICMMNRLAVVLAADSATTVSRWVDGKREERYFKGANKIFQISDMQPVGLMIYDSADILNVPWELIVKSFRAHITGKSFNTVAEYARELFTFLCDNPRFFPDDIQREKLVEAVRGVLFEWLGAAIDGVEEGDQRAAIEAFLLRKTDDALSQEAPDCLEAAHIDKIAVDVNDEVNQVLRDILGLLNVHDLTDTDQYAFAAVHEVIKNASSYLDTTGLVFAGFGDHEIFPAVIEFESQGVVGGRHIFGKKSDVALDHRTPAWMKAFAQTEMVDTFHAGFSFDAYSSIMVEVGQTLSTFAEQVAVQSGGDFAAIDDVDGLVHAAREKIGSGIIDKAKNSH